MVHFTLNCCAFKASKGPQSAEPGQREADIDLGNGTGQVDSPTSLGLGMVCSGLDVSIEEPIGLGCEKAWVSFSPNDASCRVLSGLKEGQQHVMQRETRVVPGERVLVAIVAAVGPYAARAGTSLSIFWGKRWLSSHIVGSQTTGSEKAGN